MKVDNLTLSDLTELIEKRRYLLGLQAKKLYSECRSLRKTASKMNLSHETVRTLLSETDGKED